MTPPVIGVLLAAGRGRRLGGTKQLLPWSGSDADQDGPARPLVAAAYDAIAPVCDRMVVVLGHEPDRVAGALEPRRFERAEADPDAAMLDSIVRGICAARALDRDAGVLLHPADHPEVRHETLAALLGSFRDDPSRSVMPVVGDSGGHPVLIPPAVIDPVLTFARDDGAGGLRRLWETRPELAVRLRVDDPAVTRDLDTPEDLPRGRRG